MKWIQGIFSSIERFVQKILEQDREPEYWKWLISLAGMVVVRTLIINLEQGLPDKTTIFLVSFYLQDFFFFSTVLVLIWLWLSWILKVAPGKLLKMMIWANWLVVMPLLIDLILAGKIYWSFYLLNGIEDLWGQYYTFFGNLPPAVVYFGTRISALITVIVTSAIVYLLTKKIWKVLLNSLVVYTIFFMVASFPSWVAFGYYFFQGREIFSVTAADVAAAVASPVKVWGIDYRLISSAIMFKLNLVYVITTSALLLVFVARLGNVPFLFNLKNVRIKELAIIFLAPLGGFLIGSRMFPENMAGGFYAWIALAVIAISQITNWKAEQALLELKNSENKPSGWLDNKLVFLSGLSFLGFLSLGMKFFLFWFGYKVLWSLILSGKDSKEAKFIVVQILKWSGLVFGTAVGFMLISPDQTLKYFPWALISWFLGGISLFVLTDLGDQALAIFEKPLKRIVLGSCLFVYFILGPLVFHRADVFGGSLLVGSMAFWMTEKKIIQNAIFLRLLFSFYLFFIYLMA